MSDLLRSLLSSKVVVRTLVIGLLTSILGSGFIWVLRYRPQIESLFAVNAVPVEWIERPSDASQIDLEVARLVEASIGTRLSGVLGIPIWKVPLESFEHSLRSIPWIADVKVRRHFPNQILVAVETERPALIVADKVDRGSSVRLLAVNEHGDLIADWTAPDLLPDLPFVRGAAFSGLSDSSKALRASIVDLSSRLPADGFVSRKNIAEFTFRKGLVASLRHPRVDILLGPVTRADELVLKLRRSARVIEFLQHKKISVEVLDATSVKKVVVRSDMRP